MLIVSIQPVNSPATLKRLSEQGLNERRKTMKRFSSERRGCHVGERLHEVKERKGKRVILRLLFRRCYLFLTCAPPLTHAEDTRVAAFQRPCVISPPTCSACWWWMPDKGMNAGKGWKRRREVMLQSCKKRRAKKNVFFKTCDNTVPLCVSAPPLPPCRLGVSRRVPGVRRLRRLHHLARRSMWRLHLVSAEAGRSPPFCSFHALRVENPHFDREPKHELDFEGGLDFQKCINFTQGFNLVAETTK